MALRADYRNALLQAVDPKQQSAKDQIYSRPLETVPNFVFDKRVVDVFPDMLERSVPGYWWLTEMTGVLAKKYHQPGTRIYDLGCSLGATTFSIHHHLAGEDPKITAIDRSPAMISHITDNPHTKTLGQHFQIICEDVLQAELEDASIVILNFTLQFIPPEQRAGLLDKIYHALVPGGVLILSEKAVIDNPIENQMVHEVHQHFKSVCGYSKIEVDQKNQAIREVMKIDTLQRHRDRLHEAGFSSVTQWMQCLNFFSLIAEK